VDSLRDPSIPIRQIASVDFPTRWGRFRLIGFEREPAANAAPRRDGALALLMGDLRSRAPLLRIHSQCLTGDALGSLRCDCGQQLQLAMSLIAQEGCGLLIYEEEEGRGIGLQAKLQTYELQDLGSDTVEANEGLGLKSDYRGYSFAIEILRFLGISEVRLITNNPDKIAALEKAGIHVAERVPCETPPDPNAAKYLRTKKEKMGQLLSSLQEP
jgi:GTP cyclohydrolase II